MSEILSILSWVALVFAILPVSYLLLLAFASWWPALRVEPRLAPTNRFLIAIPAHNEQNVIGATVERLLAMDYPKELFAVHVVADHCTDQTAAIARWNGAISHERREEARGGKGTALIWLFNRILSGDDYDAVVILDADTQADPCFLRIMDAHVVRGSQVIQGQHVIGNANFGWFQSLVSAMFLIDNRFQNLGRSNLGLSAKNMGDSICFRATVLRQIGWGEGLTDDYQLWQRLLLAGIRIIYEPGAIGYGEAAPNLVQARNQRARWLRGTRNASRQVRWRMLMEGVRHHDPALIDGAFQAYFPSYSTLTLMAGVLLFLQLLVNWIAGPFFSADLVASWAVIVAILFLYPFFGLALARAPIRAYLAILFGPFYIVWRSRLALTARLSRTPMIWNRTSHGEK
jgi:cellulose synthase/poly-beta-1,6-N-acetylglucosamine synthase-like glycosyltransferase